MTNTTARIKQKKKNFEIIVDLDDAIKFKKGESSYIEAEGDKIFTDSKKGQVPSKEDLESCFGTTDTNTIVAKIVKDGEILLTQEYRNSEHEKKFKQVIDFLANNSIDPQTGNPHTPERIRNALEQSHVNVKNSPIENQIQEIMEQISKIIPIKIETKRVKIIVPAIHTGKVYNLISQYKESEKWLDNGSLETVVEVPAGLIMNFYDKLNSATHGSAITQELK